MNIDAQIQAWRARLQVTGAITADSLDELESSLREAMVVHIKNGLSPQAAFDEAQRRLGGANELASEFAKVDSTALIRSRIAWMIVGLFPTLWYAFGGFVAMAVRRVEFWIQFRGNFPEDPLAAFEFWRHTTIAGLTAEIAALGSLGLCLRHRAIRPLLWRFLERLQSDSRVQAGLLFLGMTTVAGLRFASRPPTIVFTGLIPESATRFSLTPVDFLSFAVPPIALLLLLCAILWDRSHRTQPRCEQLWERAGQLVSRHRLAWMAFGIFGFGILSLWVAAIGILVLALLAGAIEASGLTPILEPTTIRMMGLLGIVPAMMGAALLALRLVKPIIPYLNKSRIVGLIQSSPTWTLLSLVLNLGFFAIAPWVEFYLVRLGFHWSPSLAHHLMAHHWGVSAFFILLNPFVFAMIAVPIWFTSRRIRSRAAVPQPV